MNNDKSHKRRKFWNYFIDYEKIEKRCSDSGGEFLADASSFLEALLPHADPYNHILFIVSRE